MWRRHRWSGVRYTQRPIPAVGVVYTAVKVHPRAKQVRVGDVRIDRPKVQCRLPRRSHLRTVQTGVVKSWRSYAYVSAIATVIPFQRMVDNLSH